MGTALASRGRNGALQERARRHRLLLVALFVSFMSGLIGLGQPIEDELRTARNLVNRHPASGDIVLVGIDDRSLAEIDRWPWPRSVHAELIDRLMGLGASRVFFDIDFSARAGAEEDRQLAESLRRHSGKVVLPVQRLTDDTTRRVSVIAPLPLFAAHVEIADITHRFDYRGHSWFLSYARKAGDTVWPTYAAKLAGDETRRLDEFPIDHAIDYRTIPTLSAVDVLTGKVPRAAVAGRQIVIGAVSEQVGDAMFFPGQGQLGGVYLHILGAETLKAGVPIHVGWLLPWSLVGALATVLVAFRSRRRTVGLLLAMLALTFALPLALERRLLFVDVVPAVFLLLILSGRLSWLAIRQATVKRARTNPLSGLPTLNVLHDVPGEANRPLIVARIRNYAEIMASIPVEAQRMLVGQIAGRLALGSSGQHLYQGDEGVFAWFADDETAISLNDRLGALHNLFRSPVRIGGAAVDLSLTFGIEAGSGRSIENRLGSAMLAAEEAASEGQRWKVYDAERLKEAPWRLSLLSQLEAAMDTGGLWVAYQPQIDLRTGQIVGAEALVRWTHPEKGPISPVDFVPMAEVSGRIRMLTEFVLDHALRVAAVINAERPGFGIAVNLSARLIDDPALMGLVGHYLAKHALPPELLTLEITETAALGTTDQHLARLAELRALGVVLSIDDYGTGLSTLDYLKRVEADEIKIDRSFVQALQTSHGDRLIVESTIKLAHSLGSQVTAEGIEDRETLLILRAMGCDRAQGFFIAKPMAWEALAESVQKEDGKITVAG